MKTMIYLDHSATTPIRPEAAETLAQCARDTFGNPGSTHAVGRAARKVLDDARDQVAALINCDPRGALASTQKRRVMISAVEHHAVLHAAEYLEKYEGAIVETLPVDSDGLVSESIVIPEDTAIVSVMAANNETGAIEPFRKIGLACRQAGVPFHTDAVQAVGKIPIDVTAMPIDLLSIAAHKIGGPKGVGALYVKRGIDLAPQQWGGAQEKARRAGTENVPSIAAFGTACELTRIERETASVRMRALRDKFEDAVREQISETRINSDGAERLPHISNIGFDGVEGESVLLALDMEGIAVSTGSACTSGSVEASHVLLAMGQDHPTALSAVRFSLGITSTEEEIDSLIACLPPIIERLRAASPLTPKH